MWKMALMGTLVIAIFVVVTLNSFAVFSAKAPTIIFTRGGIYLREYPEAQAKIGEKLSLLDLGRRFPFCRVVSEYYQGDDEGIATMIECDDVIVDVDADEFGDISGFFTRTKGAAFTNNVQVGDPALKALGRTPYCNLCTEDENPYCKPNEKSTIRYDIEYSYDNCEPKNITDGDRCWGTYQIRSCVSIVGLGHG